MTKATTSYSTISSIINDHGFRVLSDDPMFSSPYNYPQRPYKTEVKYLYADVEDGPYQKRNLLEEVMRGNISEPLEAEAIKPDLEDAQHIDCNACDIVVDEKEAATYMNPEYAHASSAAKRPGSFVATTLTATLVEATSATLLRSRVRLGALRGTRAHRNICPEIWCKMRCCCLVNVTVFLSSVLQSVEIEAESFTFGGTQAHLTSSINGQSPRKD
jgi:hypothetical protein